MRSITFYLDPRVIAHHSERGDLIARYPSPPGYDNTTGRRLPDPDAIDPWAAPLQIPDIPAPVEAPVPATLPDTPDPAPPEDTMMQVEKIHQVQTHIHQPPPPARWKRVGLINPNRARRIGFTIIAVSMLITAICCLLAIWTPLGSDVAARALASFAIIVITTIILIALNEGFADPPNSPSSKSERRTPAPAPAALDDDPDEDTDPADIRTERW